MEVLGLRLARVGISRKAGLGPSLEAFPDPRSSVTELGGRAVQGGGGARGGLGRPGGGEGCLRHTEDSLRRSPTMVEHDAKTARVIDSGYRRRWERSMMVVRRRRGGSGCRLRGRNAAFRPVGSRVELSSPPPQPASSACVARRAQWYGSQGGSRVVKAARGVPHLVPAAVCRDDHHCIAHPSTAPWLAPSANARFAGAGRPSQE